MNLLVLLGLCHGVFTPYTPGGFWLMLALINGQVQSL